MTEKKEEAKKPTKRKRVTVKKKSTTKVGGKDGVTVNKKKGIIKGTKDAVKEVSSVAVEANPKANVNQPENKEVMAQVVTVVTDNRKSSNAFIERQKLKRNKK